MFQLTLLQISMNLLYTFSSKQNKYRRTFTDDEMEKRRLAESMVSVIWAFSGFLGPITKLPHMLCSVPQGEKTVILHLKRKAGEHMALKRLFGHLANLWSAISIRSLSNSSFISLRQCSAPQFKSEFWELLVSCPGCIPSSSKITVGYLLPSHHLPATEKWETSRIL